MDPPFAEKTNLPYLRVISIGIFTFNPFFMNYTENYRGVKIDVQTIDLDISQTVQEEIRNCLDKMIKFTPEINALDVYFKLEGKGGATNSIVSMRVGVPGPDVFAEEKGEHWVPLLKAVTDKNIRQLQKAKA
ncbi:sigma 54 modulation protein/ribosomal protein S30EA [Nitritalea halalkaliphila LW7]|uniref:Sigma 54 modulation protein/ribosomal protein S30EA n=2 Tax=Nitritalea TaxID=1187887 RepID=I5CA42_9BACT|nr:sigma 54 modulation protein/ribosomal protein S30EA [Nitritalea halalkaliphila LW7]